MPKKLGEILLEIGLVNKQQLEDALREQQSQDRNTRQPIGQILIVKGFCTPDQLISALEIQKSSQD